MTHIRQQPFTIALIGGDGAGKGTIAKMLMEEQPLPLAYLYMGINIESSNVALPTSRLIEKFKRKSGRSPNRPAAHHPAGRKPKNPLWAALRLLNRIAEEWYRQRLARRYLARGSNVLFDRYFTFDYARNPRESDTLYAQRPWDDRIHRWLLARTYPDPDLVIFLWAPPEVLYARKGEATLTYLDDLMRTFAAKGASHPGFIKIDTRQGPEATFQEVRDHILHYQAMRQGSRQHEARKAG